MKITLKLFASLAEFLPAGAHENAIEVEVEDGLSLNGIIDRYRVPRHLAHLVLINGVFVQPHERDEPKLKSGDALAIWPPVAGG
jgi:molybdopterin synthase sulfur carrier subunit